MNYFAHLEVFYVVAETLNFSNAAKILRISQPAVSKRIQQLETYLAMPLLQRDRKRVSLTPQGEDLKQKTLPLIKALTTAVGEAQGKTLRVEGVIRIGALIDSGPFLDWSIDFQKKHPATIIQYEYLDNFQITEAVKSGYLDFGIVSKLPDLDSLKTYRVFREQTVLVTRTANKRDPHDYEEDEPVPFVRFRFRSPLRTDSASLFSPFFNKHRKAIGIKNHCYRFAVSSFPSMIEVLLATDTFAVMPLHTVRRQIEKNKLRMVSEKSVDGDIYLLHHDHNPFELKLRTLRDFFLAKSKALVN